MKEPEEYEAVNGLLRMLGEKEIPEPASGTHQEKLEHLILVYTQRLKEKVPIYKSLPDDSLIPDSLLVFLRSKLKDLHQ